MISVKIVTKQENKELLVMEVNELKPPPMYQVVLLNDDYTPMEFVVEILQAYFHKDYETATQIMLRVHHEGRGVCGVFPKDIASTKVELVASHASRFRHPLKCVMEEA